MKVIYQTVLIVLLFSIFVYSQTNVISNGGFESWTGGNPDNWNTNPGYTVSQNLDTVYAGSYSAKIHLTVTSNPNMGQINIPINGGDHYILQMRVYDNDPAGRARFWGYWDGASGGPQPSFYTSDTAGWQLYQYEIDAPSTATGLELQIRYYDVSASWDGDAVFYIDEVKVLAPATNVPQFSNITTGHFDAGISIDINADITDDQGINEAWLHFTSDFGATEDSVQMSNTGGDTYQGTIPAQPNNTGLEYWVSALDIDSSPNYSVSTLQKTIVGIADISRAHEVDGSGNMLYEDFFTKIKGIVTVATGTFSGTYQDDYMQDNTGGINIFDFSVIQTLSLGDSIEVSGRFSQFNSKSEILDFTINVLSPGNPVPNPVVITNVDMGEQYEGMLIRINQGLISNWDDTTSSSFDAIFTDASGDLTLHVDSDTDVPGHTAPTGFIDLVGIGSQYDYSAPYTDGFNVMPRSWADFLNPNSIDNDVSTPYSFSLKQNYPNPFNPNTNIEFTLANNSDVKIVIYNLLGQEIKSFAIQKMERGLHSFVWNGTDNRGYDVASGIYIYRITAGEFTSTKKMALLR